MSSSLHVRFFRNLEDLTALAEGWKHLYDSVPDNTVLFSSWDYIHAFISFFKPVNWLVVGLFPDRDSSHPVAIFPLEIFDGRVADRRVRICRPLGMAYAHYADYLAHPRYRFPALDTLIKVARDEMKCDALMLDATHEESRNYSQLIEVVPSQQRKIFGKKNTPFVDARSASFESYFSESQKKSTLNNALRAYRQLSGRGTLSFATYMPERDLLDSMLHYHADTFAGQHAYDALQSDWQGFFRHLVLNSAYRQLVEFSTLRLNGHVISYYLGFAGKGRKTYALTGRDPQFARYSPTKVHIYHLLRRAFEQGSIFCLGPGLYPYKENWCQAVTEIKSVWLFLTPNALNTLYDRATPLVGDLFDANRPASRTTPAT